VIRYRLRCAHAHEFEAWFASGDAYESQAAAGEISCPDCGDVDVVKAIMAPNVAVRVHAGYAASDESEAIGEKSQAVDVLREVRRALLAAAEDVGERFSEEARKVHYGEAEARGIRGTASGEEVRTLLDEGIAIVALPPLPEDAN
jgi:hypothetical protein